jgi:hypothetical protein
MNKYAGNDHYLDNGVFCSFPSSSLGMRALKLQLPEKRSSKSLQKWVPKLELGNQPNFSHKNLGRETAG